MEQKIVLGSRGSKLALVQAHQIRSLLQDTFPDLTISLKVISTEGDQDAETPLAEFGGRGAFVTTIEAALADGVIDAAVHSLKDLPSQIPPEFILAAVPYRVDPRDALITRKDTGFDTLPKGSLIGTGSIRRRMQLSRIRPDLSFKDIRGNIDTRLQKLRNGDYDAIVLAVAGLHRLGLESLVTDYFDTDIIVPAPCQGAIGIECLADRNDMLHIMKKIDNPDIRLCVDAERTFISILGMGCHAPVGAFSYLDGHNVTFLALVGTENDEIIRETIQSTRKDLSMKIRDCAERFKQSLSKCDT